MASSEAVRALRSLVRTAGRPQYKQQQQLRRSLCTDCLSKRASRDVRLDTRPHGPTSGTPRAISPFHPRRMATMASYRQSEYARTGPIAEYDARVHSGRLRDDEHQRTLIQALQDLHDTLMEYNPPPVVHPTIESLTPRRRRSFFGSMFGASGGEGETVQMRPAPGLPKGLYMFGDVGSGKTMLMDLFYETLPGNIHSKTRIHFHNFMQEVHKELHKMKTKHGNSIDAIPFVAATIAAKSTVLCFDEFQCTDVADAMILRRLIESLMAHGTVLVTTSNRHPKDLYKNGIQRESFIPCINLLLEQLRVLNLDSSTDYRKIPRPPSGVYHHPLDAAAKGHAEHWFRFLGDPEHNPTHPATLRVWGRDIVVPKASGKACWFTFDELMGKATGAADYLELVRSFEAFIITGVPGMNVRSRDLARRFITFVDAVYEGRGKLVLTTAVPLTELFMARDEIGEMLRESAERGNARASEVAAAATPRGEGADINDAMRSLMDDLGMNMAMMKSSSMFTGDEEAFAFARALSRLSEMGSQEWVERGLGMEAKGGRQEQVDWQKVRSGYHMDSY